MPIHTDEDMGRPNTDPVFPPPPEFAAVAQVRDHRLHEEAAADRLAFWDRQARSLRWSQGWEQVLDWQPPDARWFVGGTLNVSVNCLDRHVEDGYGEQVAYHWEGEPGDRRAITYRELLDEVQRTANALRELGVERGDRVAIYLPMVPELPITMLACARIGAAHLVVFAGFSANALRDRMDNAGCKVLVTADGGYRRGQAAQLKPTADEALDGAPTVEHVVVVQRTGDQVPMNPGRDHWWHDIVPHQPADCRPEEMDSEDLLFLLYTSGTTGSPKGIMHTTGGYLTQASYTHRIVFDLRPEEDVFWCTADIGWITGHSYIVYGPLANRTTVVLYEGVPNHPDEGRFWDIIERYRVTQFYTAPTTIRAFMKWGEHHPAARDLSSLRLLGTVGEPINPEAWRWYHEEIGKGRTPIVDTWWQTETGAIMVAPLPGLTPTKPGSATFPLPGLSVTVVDDEGREVPAPGGGYLVIDQPWPAMLRGVWGDRQRFQDTYWARFPGLYVAGDGARRDEDGYLWLLGRIDDVINVSGHRLSTAEIESALVSHPSVAEAAVIGRADDFSGQAIAAFVTPRDGVDGDDELAEALRAHVATVISPIAKPSSVLFTTDLPKTRSGKIMRRLLKDIAEGKESGDTSSLADPAVLEQIRERFSADRGGAGSS